MRKSDELDGLVIRQADTIARLTEALKAVQRGAPRWGYLVDEAIALSKNAGQAQQGR